MIKIRVKAAEIKRCRILEGFTQLGAAKEVNLNATSYNLIENGKLGVKAGTAKRIATLFNRHFDDLFEITESSPQALAV